MDKRKVTLEPGDVLYVPRGCIHATHTLGLGTNDPSLHLTVGAEMGSEGADFTVFGHVGGQGERGNGARIWKSFQKALAGRAEKDPRLRQTVPRALVSGKRKKDGSSQDEDRAWREEIRNILHGIVDDMVNEDLEEIVGASRLRTELRKFREETKKMMR